MISGGNATVYVSNMDRAIAFYTKVLGLELTNRFGDHWATVRAGQSLTIGLHPQSPRAPAPGTRGAVMLGFDIDEPIERVVERLQRHGVRMDSEIIAFDAGKSVAFTDPDGNPMYLMEWAEEAPEAAPASSASAR